jgi:ferric-dicitrate binding protein FerR (iron transport regulator)
MKTTILLPSIILLSVIFTWPQTSTGKVAFILGDVSLQHSGKTDWTSAKISLPIFENDAVKTGKASRCEIELVEDRMLRFSENTMALIVTPQGDKTQIKAKSGTVWVNVKKLVNRKSTFEINTNVATAAIRGTVFSVDCNADKADYLVFKGAVEVLSTNPKAKSASFIVNAGEEFTLVSDLDKYMKEEEAAFKSFLEQSESEMEQYQKEQEHAFEEMQKSNEEKLKQMLEEERKAFQPLGGGAACAKRTFDAEKIGQSDWVKWNQTRDKALGW